MFNRGKELDYKDKDYILNLLPGIEIMRDCSITKHLQKTGPALLLTVPARSTDIQHVSTTFIQLDE